MNNWIFFAPMGLGIFMMAMWHDLPLKMWISFRCWKNYGLKFAKVTTMLLAICILVTAVLGFLLNWPGTAESDSNQVPTEQVSVESGAGFLEKVGIAVLGGISTVFRVLEGEYEILYARFPGDKFWTWMLCVSIPTLMVATVILSILKGIPKPFVWKKEYLVFSQAEENSIRLAEDMMFIEKPRKKGKAGEQGTEKKIVQKKKRNKDRIAIFLRTKADTLSPEEEALFKRMKARVYPYTEGDLLRIHWGLPKKKLRFFFLSANTDLNFSRMKAFLEDVEADSLFAASKEATLKNEEKSIYQQELYLLSETDSAPMLIDRLRRSLCEKDNNNKYVRKTIFQHTDLRLLDRYRTVMYDLLQKKPLYDYEDGKTIRVLVLGLGRVGKAFFRSAASFSAMAGYETEFYIRDNNIDKQWHDLKLQYPEFGKDLMVDKGNLNVESEALISFLSKAIYKGKPFTYIVLSLGDDERNIKVASSIARYYRHRLWKNESEQIPLICVNLENEIKSDYVAEFFALDEMKTMLHVFGSDVHTFSEKMLIKRNLWATARKLHAALKEDNFAFWNEYERRSSVACVSHIPYHIEAMGANLTGTRAVPSFEELSIDQQEQISTAEHIRWMHYSRSEGMQRISKTTAKTIQEKRKTHVDTDGRLTPCLIPANELDELYRFLYGDVQKTNKQRKQEGKRPFRTFRENDRFVVGNALQLQKNLAGETTTLRNEFPDQTEVLTS